MSTATNDSPTPEPVKPRRPGEYHPPYTVTIEIDRHNLRSYSDEFLTTAWHVAQANPAPFGDYQAGELVQHIGWEIIRRWLGKQEPPLYHHQPQHNYWDALRQLATYVPGGPSGTPEFHQGSWVPKPAADATAAVNGTEDGR